MRQTLQEANACRLCPLLSSEMDALSLLLLQTWELS